MDGVVLPERRSAPISAVVAKTSAGASEHVPIARVTNLTRALEQMKKAHVWVIGLDERGTPDYTDFDFNADCCLVLGAEGSGTARSGEEDVRPSAADSDGGQRVVAECVGGGRGGDVRGAAAADESGQRAGGRGCRFV